MDFYNILTELINKYIKFIQSENVGYIVDEDYICKSNFLFDIYSSKELYDITTNTKYKEKLNLLYNKIINNL